MAMGYYALRMKIVEEYLLEGKNQNFDTWTVEMAKKYGVTRGFCERIRKSVTETK